MKIILCSIVAFYVFLIGFPKYTYPASSEKIYEEKVCKAKARFASDIFDVLSRNPKTKLDSMLPEDHITFAFVRKWIADGKSNDELYKYVKAHCLGVEV